MRNGTAGPTLIATGRAPLCWTVIAVDGAGNGHGNCGHAHGARTVACEGRLMRCLTDAILCEPAAIACRYGLPTGGDVIRAWVEPLAWWGARLRAVVEGSGNAWARGRAGRTK